jgi:hypothetical protein
MRRARGVNTERLNKIVSEIVELLAAGGLRERPFSSVPHDATQEQLRAFAEAEVRRCIARLSEPLPPGPSLAQVRQLAKAVTPFRDIPAFHTIAAWLDRLFRIQPGQEPLWQEPPPKADPGKWGCAAEGFYLLETLSMAEPTGTREGAFLRIAGLLHEACTGEPESDTDIYRACRAVLTKRRKFPR